VGLFALCGSSCPQLVRPVPPLPRVLPPTPTLEQVIQAVNQNNSQIYAFSTNEASISGPGYPSLRASLAFQRPRQFRLRAETSITGPEIDLGSTPDLFWFWVRRSQPPAIYFCRYDQFAASRVRQAIPIEPEWLIEAMGIGVFDAGLAHQGPYWRGGNRLEIHTIRPTPEGPTMKITVVDAASAVILEQHVFDGQGRLRASSYSEAHRRDPATGLIMPGVVRVNCPPAQFSMRVDLGPVAINRLLGNPAELWTMPTYSGSPAVDLCDPRLDFSRPNGPAAAVRPEAYPGESRNLLR
jgi:hypothetical protein